MKPYSTQHTIKLYIQHIHDNSYINKIKTELIVHTDSYIDKKNFSGKVIPPHFNKKSAQKYILYTVHRRYFNLHPPPTFVKTNHHKCATTGIRAAHPLFHVLWT